MCLYSVILPLACLCVCTHSQTEDINPVGCLERLTLFTYPGCAKESNREEHCALKRLENYQCIYNNPVCCFSVCECSKNSSNIMIYCVCVCLALWDFIFDSMSCWSAQVNPSEVSVGVHQHTPTHALRSHNPAVLHFKSQYDNADKDYSTHSHTCTLTFLLLIQSYWFNGCFFQLRDFYVPGVDFFINTNRFIYFLHFVMKITLNFLKIMYRICCFIIRA